jgi:hypothetical protein
MPDLSAKKSNHVSLLVAGITDALDAVATLRALVAEAKTLGYDDPKSGLSDEDFVGTNAYLDAATYRQLVAALSALDGALAAPNTVGTDSFLKVLFRAKP